MHAPMTNNFGDIVAINIALRSSKATASPCDFAPVLFTGQIVRSIHSPATAVYQLWSEPRPSSVSYLFGEFIEGRLVGQTFAVPSLLPRLGHFHRQVGHVDHVPA